MLTTKRSVIPPQLRPDVPGSVVSATRADEVAQERIETPGDADQDLEFESVVVIGSLEDGTVGYFLEYCRGIHVEVSFVDIRDGGRLLALCRYIQDGRERYKNAIYFRYAEPGYEETGKILAFLSDLLTSYRGVVVHRPDTLCRNFSKPLQLQCIGRLRGDVSVPRTSVSNVNADSANFEIAPAVVKSISAVRSTVVDVQELEQIGMRQRFDCPILRQELLRGENIRVHVVGEDVVAYLVESVRLDYRVDGDVSVRKVCVRESVLAWCQAAAQMERLEFAGIDLIRLPDGTYYCLEINPTPAYHFYEKQSVDNGGTPEISGKLLGLLRDRSALL